jgi:hypothetical protein
MAALAGLAQSGDLGGSGYREGSRLDLLSTREAKKRAA